MGKDARMHNRPAVAEATHGRTVVRVTVHLCTAASRELINFSAILWGSFHSLSSWLESTLEIDFRVSLESCYLCFWIDYQDWRLFYFSTSINSSLFSWFSLSLIHILGLWLNHVYRIGICACCIHYDSRLNLLSWVGISPCYVELNHALGCCEFCPCLWIEFSLNLQIFSLNFLKEFYSLFLIRVLDFNKSWILYLE